MNPEHLQTALEFAPDAVLITDSDLEAPGPHIQYVNRAFTALTGYTSDEILGQSPRVLQGPKTDREVLARLRRDLARFGSFHGESVNYRKDGSEYIVEWKISAMCDENRRPIHWIAILRDVTARRKAEAAVQEMHLNLESTLLTAGVGTWAFDVESNSFQLDSNAMRLLSLPPNLSGSYALPEFLGFLDPRDRETFLEAIKSSVANRGVFQGEFRLTAPAEAERWFVARCNPVESEGEIVFHGVVADISRRKEAEAMARRTESIYRAIGESIDYGVWICDAAGFNTYASQSLLDLVGITREQCAGFNWINVLHPDDAAATVEAWKQCVASGGNWERVHRYRGKDGIYHFILARGVPIRDEAGNIVLWAGINLDIDALKRAEEALKAAQISRELLLESERAARVEAERAAHLKDEFVATLSHELRTPLNAILGWIHLLKKDKSNLPRVSEGLDVIERNGRLQAQLISDLLDLSRIVAGKMRLSFERVDLRLIVGAAVESILPAAQAKSIHLESKIGAAERMYADPSRLQQIVWNLLSNAVKFTPAGGWVRIEARRERDGMLISIKDNGRGIKREFLRHLFERFRQADSSAAREHSGLGIGLAVVKELVELHGGSVTAASEGEGRGAEFSVYIPNTPPNLRENGTRNGIELDSPNIESRRTVDLSGVRVLLVDDEPDALEIAKQILGGEGAEVSVAKSADEALARIQGESFDVIVSDISMPKKDGYQFISEIRQEGNQTPAAALTAFARQEDRARALRSGFQSHITKPIEPVELVDAVARLTGRGLHVGSF